VESAKVVQSFGEFVNPVKYEEKVNQGRNGDNLENQERRQFCFEFDGEEIYAGFLSEYKIDLIECEFLHWYKFKIMLENLSEASLFKKKIALRFLDLSDFSRDKPEFYKLVHLRESVQLPYESYESHEYNAEEIREEREFESFWERV
jgi:hypothetical protein